MKSVNKQMVNAEARRREDKKFECYAGTAGPAEQGAAAGSSTSVTCSGRVGSQSHLHHERGVGGRGHAAGRKVDDRQPAQHLGPPHQLHARSDLL